MAALDPSPKAPRRGLFRKAARGASERVFDIVDPDMVLDHVDVNALLDRVDVNTLLDRVDVNRLLDRVDVDELLKRADVDALMDRVDVRAIVDRAGIPEIVAESTSHITGSALDFFRRPVVGLDEIVFRFLNRLFGREPSTFPSGPSDLMEWVEEQAADQEPGTKTGRYAGAVSRFLAFLIDALVVTSGFTLIVAGAVFMFQLISGDDFKVVGRRGIGYVVALVVWIFIYTWVSLVVYGKTVGKAVLGIRVVASDGSIVLSGRQALVRAVTYPLSFAPLFLGLVGIVFGRERRAWHDHFAGTAVVYDWGSRTARMPGPLAAYLDRRATDSQVTSAGQAEAPE